MWNEGDGALDPFALDAPPEILAQRINQSYDFSLANLNSDLDVTRVELGLSLSFAIREGFNWWAGYRVLDYDDDAPFLYDTSGSIDLVSAGLAWTF